MESTFPIKEATMVTRTQRILLLTFLTTLTLSGCAYVKALNQKMASPSVKFRDVQLREASATGIKLDFQFDVTNPNPIGVKVTALDYDLKINGSRIAKGSSNKALEVAPQGKSTVALPFELQFKDLVNTINSLIGAKSKVKYSLDVAIRVDTPLGEVELKRNVTGEFEVPRPKLSGGGFTF
jgi:LEA14-like dessication related protein